MEGFPQWQRMSLAVLGAESILDVLGSNKAGDAFDRVALHQAGPLQSIRGSQG